MVWNKGSCEASTISRSNENARIKMSLDTLDINLKRDKKVTVTSDIEPIVNTVHETCHRGSRGSISMEFSSHFRWLKSYGLKSWKFARKRGRAIFIVPPLENLLQYVLTILLFCIFYVELKITRYFFIIFSQKRFSTFSIILKYIEHYNEICVYLNFNIVLDKHKFYGHHEKFPNTISHLLARIYITDIAVMCLFRSKFLNNFFLVQ